MYKVKRFWKNSNGRLKIGLFVALFFIVVGFILPLFCPMDPVVYNTFPKRLPPNAENWLGTTELGQDTFWLLVMSVRNSLTIGLVVATIGTVLGVIVGLISGFRGGWLDRILMMITDTFVVIPSLPILILMTSLMKGQASVMVIALVLACFAWAWPSRQVRSMALSLKERDFIHTAWFAGEGTLQVVTTEILPYVATWSLSNFMNAVLNAIASESGLAVLGLSAANLPTLGNMIQWARERNAIMLKQWFAIGSPVVTTVVLFVGLFLLITGYNDYLSMKRGR